MAFRVKSSERAADDLTEIIEYINDKLCSPRAAESFYKAIDEKLALLREQPYIFSLYHDEKLSVEGYRSTVIGNFLMFYLVDDANSMVNIIRILYGKRDIPSVLDESFI